MGIKGSSTCAIYFDNVKVPANNVLGEIGRGHVIAFSILNLGRLKLGAFVTGGAKKILAQSIRYAKERVAFGKPIAEFGLIQHKLAEMAARLYAAESMSYRVDGLLNRASGGLDWNAPDAAARVLKAAEEYAIECSLVKVFASEMLDFVVDEGVQIHGGYGYHQDYLVERAYRDSRINRIFEGTNEINRLLATGMLLKRAQKKQLPLVEAVKKLQTELLEPLNRDSSTSPREFLLVQQSKKLVLFLLGAAYQKFAANIEDQQEVLAGIADAMMSAFTLESSVLRWLKAKKHGVGDIAGAYCSLIANKALREMERAATEVIAACSEGDELRAGLAVLRKLTRRDTADVIGIRRQVAGRLSEAGRYIV